MLFAVLGSKLLETTNFLNVLSLDHEFGDDVWKLFQTCSTGKLHYGLS